MRATRSVTLRVEASVAEASSISFDCLSVSAVVLRLSASAATLFTVSAPWLTILVKSVGSRATITSPSFVGGASAVPTVISTMRSPSSPCVSMRATEFFRTRFANCLAIARSTRTLPPGSDGRLTAFTRPICTPASRTVAPSLRPPTSLKSACTV